MTSAVNGYDMDNSINLATLSNLVDKIILIFFRIFVNVHLTLSQGKIEIETKPCRSYGDEDPPAPLGLSLSLQ